MNKTLNDMEKRVIIMANRTWQQIGDDVLAIDNYKDIPQKDVIEIVADADYMKTHGNDKEAYEWFQKQTREEQNRLLKIAFPYKWYGR